MISVPTNTGSTPSPTANVTPMVPEEYLMMAAAQMHKEGRLVQTAQESNVYTPKDQDEINKWDETLADHGSVKLPPKIDGRSVKDYFDTPDMMKELKGNQIDRQDLPDGGVILRKRSQNPRDLTS